MLRALILSLLIALIAGCSMGGRMTVKMDECPDSPNCVSSMSKKETNFIEPLRVSGDPKNAMEKLEKVILSMNRAEIEVNEKGYIKAVFTSAVFRFKDDVEFLLDPDTGVINIRSASRLGYYDFGVNRARLEKIRKLFTEQEK